jgi:hypothetical protein
MMVKHTPAISVLYSVRVTLTNHYWVTSDERRRYSVSKVRIRDSTARLIRVDSQNVVCPECGERFVPGAGNSF